MKVNYIPPKEGQKDNRAVLDYDDTISEDENTLYIWHSNDDDGYYSYQFEIEGTDEEIKVIKEFCTKITKANLIESK